MNNPLTGPTGASHVWSAKRCDKKWWLN
ncbi:glycerate kinase [Streptococcus agalactiae]|nr:glycerate kinase [Streptococcus agalactiae]